jgi:hypothetical protein
LATLLAIGVCVVSAAGHNTLTAVADWIRRCGPGELSRLGCPFNPLTGRYRVPDERTLPEAYSRVDPQASTQLRQARGAPGGHSTVGHPGGRARLGHTIAYQSRASRGRQRGAATGAGRTEPDGEYGSHRQPEWRVQLRRALPVNNSESLFDTDDTYAVRWCVNDNLVGPCGLVQPGRSGNFPAGFADNVESFNFTFLG